jgi:flagellar protein FliO/FliZ
MRTCSRHRKEPPTAWLALCPMALWLVPSWAVAAPPESPVTGQLIRLVIGLALVVVLVLVLAKFMARFGGGVIGARDSFRVVSSLPVGQRERVVVLQIGEQQFVLGVAAGQVSLLHRLEQPLPRERSTGVATQIPAYSWLSRVLGGRNQ